MKPILCWLLLGGSWALAHAESTFTFQGRLGSAGAPADGPHDFEFRLFDAATGGTQISGDLARDAVDVTDGIFTVQLDFGDVVFDSAPRWLEVDVREGGGGDYTTLESRFQVGAAPFAIEALHVGPGAVDTEALQDGAVTSAKIATGAVTRSRIASNAIGTQQIENNSVSSGDIRDGAVTSAELGTAAVTSDKIADGTIGPADISGGLYSRKGHLTLYTESVLVGGSGTTTGGSVSCADGNDLPVLIVCNPESPNNDLSLERRRIAYFDNDVLPATLWCRMTNDGMVSQRFEVTIGCIDVP